MANLASKTVRSVSLGQRMWNALSAWTIRNSGFQKLGLRREDLYMEEDLEIAEAVRRLPEEERNLRQYRIKRAMDLTIKHAILPKDQWTKPEEDIMYLRPYVEEVLAEMKERKKWNTKLWKKVDF